MRYNLHASGLKEKDYEFDPCSLKFAIWPQHLGSLEHTEVVFKGILCSYYKLLVVSEQYVKTKASIVKQISPSTQMPLLL